MAHGRKVARERCPRCSVECDVEDARLLSVNDMRLDSGLSIPRAALVYFGYGGVV